jgi:hypothetical protein
MKQVLLTIAFVTLVTIVCGVISPEFYVNVNGGSAIFASDTRCVFGVLGESSTYQYSQLIVADISNPDNIIIGHRYDDRSLYIDPVVQRNTLYYLKNQFLYIDDISNYSAPVNVAIIPANNVYAYTVNKNHLFLGKQNGEIEIYDVSNNQNIHYVTTHLEAPSIWKMWDMGEFIAVSYGLFPYPTVKIMEFDETTLTFNLKTSFLLAGVNSFLGMLGTRAVFGTQDRHVYIFEWDENGNSILQNDIELTFEMYYLVAVGDKIYTSDRFSTIKAWEYTSDYQLNLVSTYSLPYTSYNLAEVLRTSSNRLVLKHQWYRYFWMDVSDLNPQSNLLHTYESTNNIQNMVLYNMGNGFIYYQDNANMGLLNVTLDNNLRYNCHIDSLDMIKGITQIDNFMYGYGNHNGAGAIKTYDCSIPTQPYLYHHIPCPNPERYFHSGNTMYAGTATNVKKYNIGTDGIPVYQKNLSLQKTYNGQQCYFDYGDFTQYHSRDFAIGRMNISSPYWSTPFLAYWHPHGDSGYVMLSKYPSKIFAHNSHLYLLGKGITSYRINTTGPPEFVNTSYQTSTFDIVTSYTTYLDDYLIVVFQNTNSIAIFDLSTPGYPVLVRKIQQPYAPYSVIAKGNALFAANGTYGVDTYDLGALLPNIDEQVVTIPALAVKAYPNPFVNTLNLAVDLKQAEFIEMKVYNCKGQLVYTAGFSQLKAGKNILSWNGQDSKKKHCSAGVYLIKLQSKTGSAVQKVLLMK